MLSNAQIRALKPKEKTFLVRDSPGLYLQIVPQGGRYFIFRYWEAGKERRLSLGPYPALTLREAREKRNELHAARARGGSKISSLARREEDSVTLEAAAGEWLAVRMGGKAESYLRVIRMRLKKYLLPALGSRALEEITAGDLLKMCRKIESAGHVETAKRVLSIARQIFRYGVAAGHVEADPTAALTGALQPTPEAHFSSLSGREEIAALYRAICAYQYPVMRLALRFSILTFARPGEVRKAEWSEIDLKKKLWTIPAEKTKLRREHLVPLARETEEVLRELSEWTEGKYLFPSARGGGRPMSDGGVGAALKSLGFPIVPHGFRSMASTVLNEAGLNSDAIERQLAHVPANRIRGIYNRAQYLRERRRMMEWWSDYLRSEASILISVPQDEF